MKNKGFTLIEMMIVIAITGIITAVALPFFGINVQSHLAPNNTICKGGYLFSYEPNGIDQQIISDQGGGVKCNVI